MSELAIKTHEIQSHEFDEAKKQLKLFAEGVESSVDLQLVATQGGLFKLFEHHVKGEELNKLTNQIKDHLISLNDLQKKAIQEFTQVYQALEALDNDYIQHILISIKAAEEASRQAQESAEKAKKNSLDIKKTIEIQQETIDVLTKFKNQIDKHKHLINIDTIWNDSQKLKKDVESINNKIVKQEDEFEKAIKKHKNGINNLIKFKEQAEKSNLDVLNAIEEQENVINILNQFRHQIDEYEHLKNIDEIWDKVQTNEYKISSLNDGINELDENIREQKISVNEHYEKMDDVNRNHESQIKHLFKKMKISYVLAGCSIAITLIGIALNILGVL